MRRRTAAFAGVVAGTLAVLAAPAGAQTPPVRLAAAPDCARNINCIPGFKRVYGMDPTSVLTHLDVADAGVSALDDGLAEVAVAFSSNPQLSRPDILTLRDDKRMISDDHIVPVDPAQPAAPLRRSAAPTAQRRLAAALHARVARAQPAGHRRPAARSGRRRVRRRQRARRRRAPPQGPPDPDRLPVLRGERDARVPLRRGAARRRLPRQRPRDRAAAADRERDAPQPIDLWPGYSGSLLGYLGGRSLKRALKRIGARPLELSPAQDRNGFAMKRDVARQLGISSLSDLKRYWPAACRRRQRSGARPRRRRPPERAVGGRARQRARPARRVAARRRRRRHRRGRRLRRAAGAPRPGAEHLDQLRRDPRQRRRRRQQRLRRRRPRRRPLQQPARAEPLTTAGATAPTSPASSAPHGTAAASSASPRARS